MLPLAEMGVFAELGEEFEEVVFFHDAASELRAIVAIHSTALGPSLGGTRFYPFKTEEDALRDVLRLARGMTFKSAARHMPFHTRESATSLLPGQPKACGRQTATKSRRSGK